MVWHYLFTDQQRHGHLKKTLLDFATCTFFPIIELAAEILVKWIMPTTTAVVPYIKKKPRRQNPVKTFTRRK